MASNIDIYMNTLPFICINPAFVLVVVCSVLIPYNLPLCWIKGCGLASIYWWYSVAAMFPYTSSNDVLGKTIRYHKFFPLK